MKKRMRAPGFTMVEVMIAAMVLSVGILAMVGTITTAQVQISTNQEDSYAYNAARAKFAEMQADCTSTSFSTIFSYVSKYLDAGQTTFAVSGLEDGLGSISFPTDNSNTHLSERPARSFPGMPRDLNGDGQIDNSGSSGNHDSDYTILPVSISITWTTISGQGSNNKRTMTFTSLLALYK